MLFYAVAASVALLTPFVAAKVNLPSEGCQGQSCWLASITGSTTEPFRLHDGQRPKGGTPNGIICIKQTLELLGQEIPRGLEQALSKRHRQRCPGQQRPSRCAHLRRQVFPGLEDPNTPPPAQTSSGIVDIGAFPGLEGSQGIQASVGMDAPPPTQASIGLGDVSSTLTFPGLGLAPLQESNPAEFGNPPPSQESLGLAPPSSDAFPGLGDSPPPNQESLGLAPPSSVASPAPNGPPPSSDSLGLVPPSTAASPPLDDAFPGLSGPPPSSETLGLASPSAASPPALGFPPQESLGLVPPPSATSPPSLSGPPSQAPPELSDPTFGTAPPGQGSPPLEDGSGLVDPEFGVAPPELGVPAQGAQPPEEEETPEVPETSDAPEVPESPESEAAELGLPPLDPSDFLPGPANITSTSSNTTSSPLDGCYPYTLLFARGTSETGLLGGSVGPLLKSSLGPEWYVEGVAYEANTEGIECLGMPGGVQCVKQIDELVERCPETTVVLGGYSQGAMVARVCAAFAGDDAKENIGGLALFGDPFNGASVKGISQQDIRTWCDPNDAVCSGEEIISAAHLAYEKPGNPSIPQAVQWIRELVGDEED